MSEPKLIVSSSPHVRDKETTASIMQKVVIALIPAFAVACYVYGWSALMITAVCVASTCLTEFLIDKATEKPNSVKDWSAVVTGILLAFNLPVSAPWWLCFVGGAFAIGIVKMCFGGLGSNFMNPALSGRAFLLACWPTRMTGSAYIPADAVTTATPLGIIKEGLDASMLPSTLDMFLGTSGVYGAIGEISALALLIGGLYLIFTKVISWRIPVTYIGTVFVLSMCFGQDPFYQIFAGGLMLGAFFMATDYVSSPNTVLGQFIFAFGCGLLTVIIRQFGGYPEGVSYSILLMNVAAPLIQKYTAPRVYGYEKKKKKESEAA